ncbi:MAG: SAM-dependent methyltransferase [Rhodobacter sp.]|nr:SAM-dependent methyltransferase [Rhodobacter sp.]
MAQQNSFEKTVEIAPRARSVRGGPLAVGASSLVAALLRRIVRRGSLEWTEVGGRTRRFGPGGAPDVAVRLLDRGLPLRLLTQPSLALGEAWMEGRLVLQRGTLREFLDVLTSGGPEAIDSLPGHRLRAIADRLLSRRRHRNPSARARANVAHHYDLSDALYDLFLDRERQYSCAYFKRGDETLDEAQAAKIRHIAAKLVLNRPGLSVLDIGSGWGGLARALARNSKADVTGITLSQEQLAHAIARTEAEGLTDRVRFHLRDYRDERDRYDRIVSVGMFEHVGPSDYDTFFSTMARSLKPDGVALLHSIGIMGPEGGSDPWIRKYIFPGGYCPTLSQAIAAAERAGLWVTDVEVLRLHYAETLRHWQERFAARRDAARELYDERFCRMWEFYLAVCEAGFRNGRTMVFQLQLAHRRDAAPLTRTYIDGAGAP